MRHEVEFEGAGRREEQHEAAKILQHRELGSHAVSIPALSVVGGTRRKWKWCWYVSRDGIRVGVALSGLRKGVQQGAAARSRARP